MYKPISAVSWQYILTTESKINLKFSFFAFPYRTTKIFILTKINKETENGENLEQR